MAAQIATACAFFCTAIHQPTEAKRRKKPIEYTSSIREARGSFREGGGVLLWLSGALLVVGTVLLSFAQFAIAVPVLLLAPILMLIRQAVLRRKCYVEQEKARETRIGT